MPHLLVIAEHARGLLKPAPGAAAGFARQDCAEQGGTIDILVRGSGIAAVAQATASWGARKGRVGEAP